MPEEPLVSIVTPSYNMASFLPEAIESVLSQDYPRIEYIVMDGGSEDGTVDILQRYKDRLQFVSQRDGGAADAINQGFRKSQGTILGWLNADDTYRPAAVSAAVRKFLEEPQADVVYGEGYLVDRQGDVIRPYATQPFSRDAFRRECYICQPAAFFRRSAFEDAGMLNAALHSAFDYDLWIRLSKDYDFVRLPQFLANSRMHRDTKTLGNRAQVYSECLAILRQHYGYAPFPWIYSSTCYRVDKRDQFFDTLRPSFGKYLLSLVFGCWYNRRHPLRFLRDWAAAMTWSGLLRQVRRTRLGRVSPRQDASPGPRNS